MMIQGLSAAEAKKRLLASGLNELPVSRPKTIWRIALDVFREPMFLLLISCGGLYILIGDLREGIIMLATGLRICGIKIFPIVNMLPALALVMPVSAAWARLFA